MRALILMANRPSLLFPTASLLLFVGILSTAGCGALRNTPATSEDPNVVALFADDTLTLADFEMQYARAVGGLDLAQDDSLEEYQDFLERYVNFRLKVLQGEAAGYDKHSSIEQEINSYRGSFAKPFLMDKEVLNPIISDLYEKGKEMVEVSHILLRVPEEASPSDTLAIFNQMTAIRDSALQGIDFGDLAMRHSHDPSAQRNVGKLGYRGWLGYTMAGRMVKPFEDWVYWTPIGKISPVVRTQYGYHIIYVHDRKEAVSDVRVWHIMVTPDGSTPADSSAALDRILGYKQRIEAGERFQDIARVHSDEKRSAQNGGDLNWLRYDNYQVPASFREAAFAIEELNTISDVVETQFGLHLLMITERKKPGTYEEKYEELKSLATRLPRTRNAEKKLAAEIRATYHTRIDTTGLMSLFESVGVDSLLRVVRNGQFDDSLRTVPVVSLGDSTYAFGQVATFARENQVMRMLDKEEQLVTLANDFLDNAAISYEAAALENRDEEFRMVMDEFRNGLVLFKLMEDSVWTAAAQDSAGLAAYYETHRERYQFPERMRIISLSSRSDSLLESVITRLDEGVALGTLLSDLEQDSTASLAVDTMLIAGATNSVYDQALGLADKEHTPLVPNRVGHIVLFKDGTEAPRSKTFEEARTEVANDYQQLLEERLTERLRKEYKARLFPNHLIRAFQASASETPTTSNSTQ
ncbi:MAG: peptidylprolyl isomerase [Rhodothermales bacterium]